MKRLHNIAERVKLQIVKDYKDKVNGQYRYTLREIADKHEVSLSSVNNLARTAHCQCRPQGGSQKTYDPSPRDLKVLRDCTIPGITYAEVGRLNPRQVIDASGRTITKPLSKARVHQIVETWRKRGMPKLHGHAFKKGQRIEWDGQFFTVLRYDNNRQGAVRAEDNGEIWDPFLWVFKGDRAKLVKDDQPTGETLSTNNPSP